MRRSLLALLLFACACLSAEEVRITGTGTGGGGGTVGKETDPKIKELAQLMKTVAERSHSLTCVTAKPVLIPGTWASYCALPPPIATSVHGDRYIKVFVTPESAKTARAGTGVYPVGTLVLKEKSTEAEFKHPELFTAMVKREAGYNPTAGDWEFMVLDAHTNIVARGKIDSCMECHQRFRQTDGVSHVYAEK